MYIPATLRNLANLPWQGAVAGLTYQRLTLHLWLAALLLWLAFTSLFLLVLILLSFLNAGTLATGIVKILAIGLVTITALWLTLINLKVVLLRARGLGITARLVSIIIALVLIAGVLSNAASYLQENKILLLLGYVPLSFLPVLPFVGLLTIGTALVKYLMNFETHPLGNHQVALTEPLTASPGRFENAMLFLFQIYLWFAILSAPLWVILYS